MCNMNAGSAGSGIPHIRDNVCVYAPVNAKLTTCTFMLLLLVLATLPLPHTAEAFPTSQNTLYVCLYI